MNRIILLLLFFATLTVVKADDRVLQVWLADGQVVSISLNDEPRTTYQDGNLVITTSKNSVTYPLEQVKRFTYVSLADGIDAPRAVGAAFSTDGETLTFTGLQPHTSIYLYNVAGQLLKTLDSGDRSKAVISASRLPIGVYIVKVNGGTYKIRKR